MARPSEDRIEGYHCENRIKKGKRGGQICGKLLFAKNGLTIWDDRCESTHSLVGLLRKALDLKYLTPEDIFQSVPELCHQQPKKKKEDKEKMAQELDKKLDRLHQRIMSAAYWEDEFYPQQDPGVKRKDHWICKEDYKKALKKEPWLLKLQNVSSESLPMNKWESESGQCGDRREGTRYIAEKGILRIEVTFEKIESWGPAADHVDIFGTLIIKKGEEVIFSAEQKGPGTSKFFTPDERPAGSECRKEASWKILSGEFSQEIEDNLVELL